MARKPDNSGCGLMAICLLLILALAKCSGGATDNSDSTPSEESSEVITGAASETATMYVATATLNCRAEPHKDARPVEKLKRGDAVSTGETRGSMGHIGPHRRRLLGRPALSVGERAGTGACVCGQARAVAVACFFRPAGGSVVAAIRPQLWRQMEMWAYG